MIRSNRLRWRLTLFYSLVTFLSGLALLAIVIGLSRSLPPADGPAPPHAAAVDRQLPARGATVYIARGADENYRKNLILVPGLALLIMVPISFGAGWVIAGRILRPVRTMTDSLQRISGRNVHERLAVAGPRTEFKDLADTIDGLLGRLEAALEGHKRFVANAAHELRTPLTVEHALLEEPLIDEGATAEDFRANFERLLAVNRRRGALLESLLTLAGSESARDGGVPVRLDAVAATALADRRGELERHDLRLDSTLRPALLAGDPMLVARLVANLCDNAIHYNRPGGTVEVTVRTLDGHARLIVANTGPPVPPDEVDRLFEPFQRLQRIADDGHHGLGLSIVRAIATAHGATIHAGARTGGGLTVEVLFPAAEHG
ncbi:HAMP domain-containing histidine kinase [Dactylosporangium vinaceum]|uniref:histidine kinase n=1 Tax=Dactylosporangium vinaceum TaxID=53362 RepID=A0ABV5MNI3_9ACTN|nr:HAMP domain-containing sensor histidine kinase [Dactylosporangium vinaceum]UAB92260.1 HAMP domain-containing histidine kinase [Dactylosporangium vinaceum]